MPRNKMEIKELGRKDEKAWDEFVNKSNDSTFFHQIGWKRVVEKTYGHKSIYLFAEEDGEVEGILPLFLIKSLIFGKKLVSLPFTMYGGVCSENDIVINALVEEAKKITIDFGADYLELRHFNEKSVNLPTTYKYFTSILNLHQNLELLCQNFRKSTRRYVRKSSKMNFKITIVSKDVKKFYEVYSRGMRDLGTPAEGYTFFKNLLHEFGDYVNMPIVEYEGEIIDTVLLLYFRDTVIYERGASLEEYKHLNPNYLLFWELINDSCEKGLHFFDFGRSLWNSGTFFFKSGWGANPKQLYYQYYLGNKVRDIPDISQASPKRKMFAKVWRRVPVPIADKLGPMLRRNVP